MLRHKKKNTSFCCEPCVFLEVFAMLARDSGLVQVDLVCVASELHLNHPVAILPLHCLPARERREERKEAKINREKKGFFAALQRYGISERRQVRLVWHSPIARVSLCRCRSIQPTSRCLI